MLGSLLFWACHSAADYRSALSAMVEPEVCDRYWDGDADGYGDQHTAACTSAPGWVERAGDCDDGDPSIHPDAAGEACDGLDSDCDGKDVSWTTAWSEAAEGKPDLATVLAGAAGPVCLQSGTFRGNFALTGDGWELIGASGAERTILDGGGTGPVLRINGAGTTRMVGLSIRNGTSADPLEAAGLSITDSGPVSLEDLHIVDNHNIAGSGGLSGTNSEIILIDGFFSGNRASAAAALWTEGGTLSAKGLELADNQGSSAILLKNLEGGLLREAHIYGTSGRAIQVEQSSDLLLSQLDLRNNAGALACDQSRGLRLNNLVIAGNEAAEGAGILGSTCTFDAYFLTIVENVSQDTCGTICLTDEGSSTLWNVSFVGNRADSGGDMVVARSLQVAHLHTYNNVPETFSAPLLQDEPVLGEPAFKDYILNTAAEDWDLHLSEASPLIDAGVFNGTPADIGGYGGPAGDWQ